MTRAVVYGRQSKDKKISIDDQLSEGAERAADEGWEVVATLQDGMSASRHADTARTDWPMLVKLVQAREVELVWLWEASRGDRTASSWMAFLEDLQAAGVVLYIETDERSYDLNVARDWKTMAGAGVDAAGESELIRERTLRAKRRARRSGDLRKVLGGRARYGWQDTEAGWQVEPTAAAVLAKVAERVVAGEQLGTVFTELAPLPCDSYGEPVDYKRLRATLLNPLAAGMLAAADGTLGRVVEEAPLEEETWRRLTALYDGRKRGRPTGGQYPLGKLLRCGGCGNQLSGEVIYRGQPKREGGEPTPYYQCKNRHKGGPVPCRGVAVSADELHTLVRGLLEDWAELAPAAHAMARAQLDLTGQADALRDELAFLQERMADLGDRRDAQEITAARYVQSRDTLRARMTEIRIEQETLDRAASEATPLSLDWPAMTPTERARWVAEVCETPIVVHPRQAGRMSLEDRLEIHPRRPLAA